MDGLGMRQIVRRFPLPDYSVLIFWTGLCECSHGGLLRFLVARLTGLDGLQAEEEIGHPVVRDCSLRVRFVWFEDETSYAPSLSVNTCLLALL